MKFHRYPHLGVALAILISLALQLWTQTAFCCSDPYSYFAPGCSDQCLADCPDQSLIVNNQCDRYAADGAAGGCLTRSFTSESAFNSTRLQNMLLKYPLPLASASVASVFDASAGTRPAASDCVVQQSCSDALLAIRAVVLLI